MAWTRCVMWCAVMLSAVASAQCHLFTNCVDCALIRECGWCDTTQSCIHASLRYKANGSSNGCPIALGASRDPWAYKTYHCNCSQYTTCGDCARNGCAMCSTGICVTPYSDGRPVNCSSSGFAVCAVNPGRAVEFGCASLTFVIILFLVASAVRFPSILQHIPCNKLFFVTVGFELIGTLGRVLRFVCERTNLLDGANPASDVRRPLEMGYLFVTLVGQATLGLMYLSIAINFRFGADRAEWVRYIGVPLLLVAAVPAFVPLLIDRNYYDVVDDEVLFGVTLAVPTLVGLLSIMYVVRGIWYMRRVKVAETRVIVSRLSFAAVLLVYQVVLLVILTNRGSSQRIAVQIALIGASLVGALEMLVFIVLEKVVQRWRVVLFGISGDRVQQLQYEIEMRFRGGINRGYGSQREIEDPLDRTAAQLLTEATDAERRDPQVYNKSIAVILAELGSAGMPRYVERKPSRGAVVSNTDW